MRWRFWLGVAISVILVVLIVRQVQLNQLISILRSARYQPLVLGVLSLLTTLVIRSWRWQQLLEPIKRIRMPNLLSATSIGAMTDMVFPARAGDVVRAYVIGRKEEVGAMVSLSTIVVERVFDVVTILLISVCLLPFLGFGMGRQPLASGLGAGILVATFLCLALLGGLWLLRSRTAQATGLVRTILFFLPKPWLDRIVTSLESFVIGLKAIRGGWHLVSILGLSILLWSAFALSNLFILSSFGLQLPPYSAFLFLVFQVLGVTLPSSPGFIGTYHAAVLAGFAVFEVSQDLALSVAITMHAAFFFPFILLGFIFLWRENLSFAELLRI